MIPDGILTPAAWAAWKAQRRFCSGCNLTLTNGDFSVTSERGRRVARSRCKVCMSEYYARYQRTKRAKKCQA